MKISELQTIYARHPKVKALGNMIVQNRDAEITVSGLVASSIPMCFACMGVSNPESVVKPILFIMNDADQAGYFYHDLTQILGEENVLYFPSSFRRAVKYGQRDNANEILRTDVLTRLEAGQRPLFVVSYPEAVAEMVVTRKILSSQTLSLKCGEEPGIDNIRNTLMKFGFTRTDYVYEPGQFAIRGSIIDVYSYSCENPYRIDFFGDEIDSIRTFEVQTQLSLARQEQISIVPELCDSQEQRETILNFMSEDGIVVMQDMLFVIEETERIWHEGFSMQALMVEEATEMDREEAIQALKRDSILVQPEDFRRQLLDHRRILLTPQKVKANICFDTIQQPIFHKIFDLLFQTLQGYQAEGYKIYILADSEKQTDRLESIFDDQNTDIRFTPIDRTIHEGFVDRDRKMVVFTDHQIFDRFHKYNLKSDKARKGKMALTLKEIRQFEIGDYVVHTDHGVGRFAGLVSLPENGVQQEKIRINYEDGGVVYVSIHSLHKVSKYKGREGEAPKVNKLGTAAWDRLKERTKTKIKDIARDLIKLYSRRRQEKGFAYSPDTFLQHELEASFLYEDTPDQLKATQDVKADMEKSKPMDRLVCGDVGFGKTEVAIRAAFKAVADNKQVAVLVPTTVLAYQHYHTFQKRLKDLPVRVDYLSRARTPKETKELLNDLATGQIGILVGTHRLISKSVKFLDLGLLIIDEEQKFGVRTKEQLRQMKVNVDTLTLTATPIPRTLQFSLMGARDLSVIQTPPPNRYPIQTEVCRFSGEVIAEAVNFEMSRNGQVFLVSNRISSLPELESLIHKYIPDARVAVGHGQMPPEKLEEIILGFARYDYDVLISTTIVESGIDIPNANTIIINQAHNFGLSDLHQMRGRVGRGNQKAFCYLLAPPLSSLNPEARRRLQAIENFSDLGSGIHIAMQDLDIRGAGNLLGAEQSGFIADLGYETYQKILNEAVRELRNEEFQELYAQEIKEGNIQGGEDFVDECQMETDIPMSFPEYYVPTSSERMLLYRELDGLHEERELEDFRNRMKDRFGTIPEEGEDLIRVVTLRQLGKHFGAERLSLRQNRLRLNFVSNPNSAFFQSPAFGRIISFYSANVAFTRLDEKNGTRFFVIENVTSIQHAIDLLRQIDSIGVS